MRKILIWTLTLATLFLGGRALACTNFIVTKGASTDGSTMISYSADSHVLYGELYFWPAAKYAPGELLKVYEWDTGKYLGEIPQARQTYSVVGNMNEHQLVIGETTYGGRKELVDTTGLIDYGSLIYITLQRAKNAREAIKVIAELVEKYGYYSSGESFSIGDANEAWILEIIGKGMDLKQTKKGLINLRRGAVWVARRIPDGYVSGHANQARITTFPLANGKNSITSKQLNKIFNPDVDVVYAADVISFAKKMKFFEGKDTDFDFSQAYAPVDFGGARFCDARVWSFFNSVRSDMDQYIDYMTGHNLKNRMPLWVKPEHKVSVDEVMKAMRNHFEGTDYDMRKDPGAGPGECPYRWRPLTWKYNGKTYINERCVATQQTGFVFVSQSRSWLPDPIGGIFWFGVDDAASTVFNPIYCGITRVPEAFAVGNGNMLEYSPTSAFWLFNKVANFCYLRYNMMHADLEKQQVALENKYIAETSTIDKKAEQLYKSNPAEARGYLTDQSIAMVQNTMKVWNHLFEFLLVKYIDFNVKREENGEFLHTKYGKQHAVPVYNPEYPDSWKEDVVKATGDKLLMPEGTHTH